MHATPPERQALIERLAREHLGVPRRRVEAWRYRQQVPPYLRLPLFLLAEAEGVRLEPADFEGLATGPERERRQLALKTGTRPPLPPRRGRAA
jgi:hypothetical protein